ncbi:MAG: hypothetical protein M1118_04025 [Chloroflexi bacterium]|nr:hypothetical protein [Chloroflexota bacterium]
MRRAQAILVVAEGQSFTAAARRAGVPSDLRCGGASQSGRDGPADARSSAGRYRYVVAAHVGADGAARGIVDHRGHHHPPGAARRRQLLSAQQNLVPHGDGGAAAQERAGHGVTDPQTEQKRG